MKINELGINDIKVLSKLGIREMVEIIYFLPFRYEIIKKTDMSNVNSDDKVIIDGLIQNIPSIYYINKSLNKMSFKIETNGNIFDIIIFNRAYLKSKFKIGEYITIIGKLNKNKKSITASDLRFKKLSYIPIIEPIYHLTYGITQKKIISIIRKINFDDILIEDYIPIKYINKYNFLDKKESLINLHRPINLNILNKSIFRFKYEELFIFMMKMNYLKNNKEFKLGHSRNIDKNEVKSFISKLPFDLTIDQINSIDEIFNDLISNKRMNRLLQGDVGSGKTVVSFIACYINFLSGFQSALMAPTEILANQHYHNIKKIFSDTNINIELLTGKTKLKDKKDIYNKLENNKIDIIVGTHALISDKVIYNNLGLVITDEQHRFGVLQRSTFKNKGNLPDILYMSATPIPRTYALTLYGDMSISNIKTRPFGRKDIKTIIKNNKDIKDILNIMYEQLKLNHQVYVVAPLISESEKLDNENVDSLFNNMNKAFGNKYNLGYLHGKMNIDEKNDVMNKFKNNEIQILISTTVIEVGIDVENATCMVIFDAYRFGLSTLHQLRGRVGRSDLQSFCILVSNGKSERLKIMENVSDGFLISEEDFKLRGSGNMFGYEQSGDLKFTLANLKNDYSILVKAKKDVEEYIKSEEGALFQKSIINNMKNLD